MNSKKYLEQSERTVPEDVAGIIDRLSNEDIVNLLHSGIGLATEGGEFLDAVKKHIFYGEKLNLVNLREELGDVLWYIALAMRTLDTNFEAEMQRNINKLQARFPTKFTKEHALLANRDLKKEHSILAKEIK